MAKKLGIDLFGSNAVLSHGLSIGSSYKSQVKVNRYHTTLSPINIDTTITAIIVGGGGSGGSYYAGGGGAGGGIVFLNFNLAGQTSYGVDIGAGGIWSAGVPQEGQGTIFAGIGVRGGGHGADGGDKNGPDNPVIPNTGGGGAASAASYSGVSDGATGDGYGKAGGNGLWDDNDVGTFDALGGGGGGYLTAGSNALPWQAYSSLPPNNCGIPQNGGNGVLVSHFFPDVAGSDFDWGIGHGGGGGCAQVAQNYNYSTGGFLGGGVQAPATAGKPISFGGRGSGQATAKYTPATSGAGYLSRPAGSGYGAGNGGGGGGDVFGDGGAGNGSDGAVILKIPENLPWNQDATNDASPYLNVSDPINGNLYLIFPVSGSFIML